MAHGYNVLSIQRTNRRSPQVYVVTRFDCTRYGHHRSWPPVSTDSTGGGRRRPRRPNIDLIVDLIYAAKPYANYPGGCVDCGLNVKYSIRPSITSNMRPTDERDRPMHGRPHAHPVGP